jgi:hypothetical protein
VGHNKKIFGMIRPLEMPIQITEQVKIEQFKEIISVTERFGAGIAQSV